MGIKILCKKTGTCLVIGECSFNSFRDIVAFLHSAEFGTHYAQLSRPQVVIMSGIRRQEFFDHYNQQTAQLIKEKKVNKKVADFCLQPEDTGKIQFGTCQMIYDLIKDHNDHIIYGYASRNSVVTLLHIKDLFKECAERKSDLVWCIE